MKSNQLKIFVSSTFVDLKDTRAEILKFLGVLKSDIISMEVFGSDELASVEVCLSNVDACNFFIGIYAERYGFINKETGRSLTEMEYHAAYAKLQGGNLKGMLLYVLHEDADWPMKYVDREAEPIQKLRAFKNLVTSRHTVTFFKKAEDLTFYILRDTIRKLELGVDVSYKARKEQQIQELDKLGRPLGMGFFSSELSLLFYGRTNEIEQLTSQIVQFKFSLLIGISGIGKTSLLNAGVIPKLKKIGWIICVTRPLSDPLENLRRSIWSQLLDGVLPSNFALDDVVRAALDVIQGRKLLIVIDQFDDMLNSRDQYNNQKIIDSLGRLFLLNHPDLHILISYRGDVESEIGMVWQKISGAADGLPRYYLTPLDKECSTEIVSQTLSNLNVQLDGSQFLEGIIDDISEESENNGHLGVFPPFIQMIISTIYSNLTNDIFTQEAYNELGKSKEIISNYLYNQLNYLGSDKQNGIKFLIALVSNYGTKTQKSLLQIGTEIEMSEEQMQPILIKLLELRLIRPLEIGFEITHDLLAMTILNGLMTDEEKDVRRFKYLLESKAQAFATTSSELTFSEHSHIYKFRKRIKCNDLEFTLLAKSSQQNQLPIAYWITPINFITLAEGQRIKFLTYQMALDRLNGNCDESYDTTVNLDDQYLNDEDELIDLKKLALRSKEISMIAFFDEALRTSVETDTSFRLSDRTQFKSMLAAVKLAKFGNEQHIHDIVERIKLSSIVKKQKYIYLRSAIYLARRLQFQLDPSLFYEYGGRHWRSVLNDFNSSLVPGIDMNIILRLIELNDEKAPYVDYLVALLSKVMTPENFPQILTFIEDRIININRELLFDKYLILALDIGADYGYFLRLIEKSINVLNIKYSTLLHQRIADLCSSSEYDLAKIFVDNILFSMTADIFFNPAKDLVLHMSNRYFYTWVMGCTFCNLATRADIPILTSLLTHKFFTIRKAAFDRIVKIGTEDDLKHFLGPQLEPPKHREFASALFMLDCKAYMDKSIPELYARNLIIPRADILKTVADLLPKVSGEPVDPETLVGISNFSYSEDDEQPF
jgi:hypothetical protein